MGRYHASYYTWNTVKVSKSTRLIAVGECREAIAAVVHLSTAMEGEAGHVGRLHASLYTWNDV